VLLRLAALLGLQREGRPPGRPGWQHIAGVGAHAVRRLLPQSPAGQGQAVRLTL